MKIGANKIEPIHTQDRINVAYEKKNDIAVCIECE